MTARQYTPKLAASHVSSGTAATRSEAGTNVDQGRRLQVPKLHTEIDDRIPATVHGGISLCLVLWRKLKISELIDERVQVLRRHRPYHESDHVLAHVLNLFAGGSCIHDQKSLQQDGAVLRMLGTDRFPDPTTSGDFLRRFDDELNPGALDALRSAVNSVQDAVWSEFDRRRRRRRRRLGSWGRVDLDSHIIELCGNQREGADFSYTKKWSYHPLLVTLANTGDIVAVRNRTGNAPSAEGVEDLLETHLPRVKQLFSKVVVRGDSAFDRRSIRQICREHHAYFAHSVRRLPDRVDAAEAIAEDDWQEWKQPKARRAEKSARKRSFRPRRKGTDRRRQQALNRNYKTISKDTQWIAEVQRRPTDNEPPCRMIVIREKHNETWSQYQTSYFDFFVYRIVFTNLPDSFTASDVVDEVYHRCDQENIIEQLKNELPMWRMPVREATGNAAWAELARLAWNISKWLGLLALPLETVRWECKRFRRAYVQVAVEVVRRSRQTWVRFNPTHRFVKEIRVAHNRLGP